MAEPDEVARGEHDLEKGMQALPASAFATILRLTVLMLMLFNSPGLIGWTQRLPSNEATAWLAERAADWDRAMRFEPARVLETLKNLLQIETR